jgi:hypothetical protein
MQTDQIESRVEALIEKGSAVLATYRRPGSGVIGPGWVDTTLFTEWQSQSLTLLTASLGPDHTYVETFRKEVTKPQASDNHAGIGVLRAFKEDLANGYLFELRTLVTAEVFTDFLDMAEHLLDNGYMHAAASLTGAVLEDGMRQMWEKRSSGKAGTSDLQSLNSKLVDAKVYTRLVQKQVSVGRCTQQRRPRQV